MIARRMRGPVAMSFILACLVTSTTLAQAQSQQSARPQNIFEALFPGLVKERIRREQAFAPQEQAPRAPAPVQKVSAPQYYTYKVDRLARIELQSLVPAAAAAASTPTGTPAPSGDALVQSVSDVLDSSITGTANAATAPAQPAAMPAMDDAQAYASIAGRFAELSVMAEPQVGKAVVEHYKASPKLMWLDNTLQANARALAALKVLSDAGQIGLNPEDYAVSMPVVDAAAGENARLDAAARFEIALTARATRYALDAAGGLVVADRLSGYHDFPERQLSAKEALEKIAAGDPASVLPAFNPDNAPFKALVAELARLDSERDDSIAIPETVLIKPGEDSTDLPLVMAALEKRASPELKAQFADLLAAVAAPSAPSAGISPLNATPAVVDAASAPANSAPLTSENDFGNDAAIAAPAAASEPAPQTAPGTTGGTKTAEPASGEPVTEEAANATAAPPAPSEIPATLYTLDKVELMKAFQKEAGLTPDGVIGRNTVARLTGDTVSSKRERVIIALEQLRWHPRDLGPRHVFINQPAYRARYVEGGKTKLDMRVVVGTKANQTNFFHDMIETVEYNPYWGVPRSILVNEFLPKLRENPAYLDERGYEVTDGQGNRIASSSIDWYAVGSDVPFDVRQSPGEANALGELKILFPNKHAIYMHDTPARDLFKKDVRAFSHGCVRLAEPREMAAAVLGTTVQHVEEMLTKGHGQDDVPVKFPVYVAYFTAWPTDEGKVEYFADMYGRDEAVKKAFAAIRAERGAAG